MDMLIQVDNSLHIAVSAGAVQVCWDTAHWGKGHLRDRLRHFAEYYRPLVVQEKVMYRRWHVLPHRDSAKNAAALHY